MFLPRTVSQSPFTNQAWSNEARRRTSLASGRKTVIVSRQRKQLMWLVADDFARVSLIEQSRRHATRRTLIAASGSERQPREAHWRRDRHSSIGFIILATTLSQLNQLPENVEAAVQNRIFVETWYVRCLWQTASNVSVFLGHVTRSIASQTA